MTRSVSSDVSGPHWMWHLGRHYQAQRQRYPTDQLVVVFDIDGTVVDPRHTQLHLLRRYDAETGSHWFLDKSLSDITCYENHLADQLVIWGIPVAEQESICDFYFSQCWREDVLLASQGAYPGVLDVLAWFEQQEMTCIAFATGRCESTRPLTMRCLGALCETAGIEIHPHRVKMNGNGWLQVPLAKQQALLELEASGFRVVAMIDNEPGNLNALSDWHEGLLLLHVQTSCGHPQPLHPRCVPGAGYDLEELLKAVAAR